MSSRSVVAGLLFALLAISELNAVDSPQLGAIEQRGGPVSQDVKLPPLELTNAQRELVRKELLLKHNEVESRLFAMILNLSCQCDRITANGALHLILSRVLKNESGRQRG